MNIQNIQRIRLDAIVFDAGTQIREAINEGVVAEYVERMGAGDEFPAVVLFHDGNHYYMADGFHRGLASKRLGLFDIAADVQAGTKTDALWFALGANKTNGHRMTPADKKHAVHLALQSWPEMSMHQIADQVGCSYNYIQQERPKVVSAYHLPDRVTGKDGKSYPASRRAAPVMEEVQVPFKSRSAIASRRERMREMAAQGHTSRQIAAAVGIAEETCRATLKKEGIDVPADRSTNHTHRHDSTRIVEHIVMDAENLTADVNLIDFSSLDRERLGEWADGLTASRRALDAFIRRLIKEQQKHGEAA